MRISRRHVVEHRRRHQRVVGLAAADQLRALGQRVVDQRVAVLDRAHADHRAEHHRPGARVAERQRRRLGGEALDEVVGDLRVDDDALGATCRSGPVGEGAEGGGVDRVVDVGVVEHHQRRLAAELEHRRLQVLGAGLPR